MAKLKPWSHVLNPRQDIKEDRPLDASEFAVHLDHVRDGRAFEVYTKPDQFFGRTYLTGSLLELASQCVRRLSGVQVQTNAVFNMATQFGGGKTHALTTLYHLANHGDDAKAWKGVETILNRAEITSMPKADVAVFVGQEFDVLQGRGGTGEPTRLTPWGEIAWQLGQNDPNPERYFAAVREHDEQKTSPAGDALRAMLPDGPTLILLDEMLNYVSRGRKFGLRDQLYDFLQNLGEEARGRDNLVLCISVPASEMEMNPEDHADLDRFRKLLDRLGRPIVMSADDEIHEIVRRRLFDWPGQLPGDGTKTVNAYAEWAIENVEQLSGVSVDTARDRFQSCYPFHPSVLSVFERKWQSLPHFQRTRGVLKMLALWVAKAYREQNDQKSKEREPLITFGSAPFEDSYFRQAMFGQMGDEKLEIPVGSDIAGKADSHATSLDKQASPEVRDARLHRRVASTIFFESNGGMSQAKAVASLPEIRTAVGGPDLNLVHVEQVLDDLTSNCFYLNWDKNKYRFGLTPNLNQMLSTRRGAVKDADIDEAVREVTEKVFAKKPAKVDCKFHVRRSNDVPDKPVLTFVVLDLEHAAGEAATTRLMDDVVRNSGTSGRTCKSALVFAAPDGPDKVREAARDMLAWQDIDEDPDTRKQLDESQVQLLKKSTKTTEQALKEAVFRSYRHLHLLGKDNTLRSLDLGNITSSSADSLVGLYLRELESRDEVVPKVGSSQLAKAWPGGMVEWSTKAVRNAFYSSPSLPRVVDPDSLKQTIADGVSGGQFGLATKEGDQLKLWRFEESVHEADVDFDDDVFLLRADDARKLKEPPRLARIEVHPHHPAPVKPGETIAFTCRGVDQYEGTVDAGEVSWTATGGMIDTAGQYVAGDAPGQFSLTVTAGNVDATIDVRIVDEADDDYDDPPPPGGGVIRWSGEIPPQKWMNFYTKVLAKFASNPGLKLNVSFEVDAEGRDADSLADDVRSSLKELDLSDDVH